MSVLSLKSKSPQSRNSMALLIVDLDTQLLIFSFYRTKCLVLNSVRKSCPSLLLIVFLTKRFLKLDSKSTALPWNRILTTRVSVSHISLELFCIDGESTWPLFYFYLNSHVNTAAQIGNPAKRCIKI